MNVSIIIVAAGSGSRAKLNKNKVLFEIDGQTVLEKTVRQFLHIENISEIIVTASTNDLQIFKDILLPLSDKITVCLGGATRTESVKNALEFAYGDIVLIHDGARPFVSKKLINSVIDCAIKFGSAIPTLEMCETLGFGDDLIERVERQNFYSIQTPQGFNTCEIKKAYSKITNETFTDDSGVYCKFIAPCHRVQGEKKNIKLTYPEDFEDNKIRIGTGFDLHRLVEGRKLILGGVEIPHYKGLLGHSDADVVTHAVMDAILSAAALRDIGYYFPDTDPQYEGISSILLLEKVMALVAEKGYKVSNLSITIMAEKPKLMKYVPELSTNLAKVIHISTENLGITCTTLEGLGIIGEEMAIATRAYVALQKIT